MECFSGSQQGAKPLGQRFVVDLQRQVVQPQLQVAGEELPV